MKTCNSLVRKKIYISIHFYDIEVCCCCYSGMSHSDPVDYSMPGLPVLHCLLHFTQTHVHWIGDTVQPSQSLSSPSPPAFSLSQHQGLFPMGQLFPLGGQSKASALASILPMNIQGWFPLGLIGLISLQSKGLSRVFCNTTVRKHQFFGTQHSFFFFFLIYLI